MAKVKFVKLAESDYFTKSNQIVISNNKLSASSAFSDHNFSRRTSSKVQKRSAGHIKTVDTNFEVGHSFDFLRTISAVNIKLQEANSRLRESEGKRVHEHACLQKS